jgi:hypothetical protein
MSVIVHPDRIKLKCTIKLLKGDSKVLEEGSLVKVIEERNWPKHAKEMIGTSGLYLIYCQFGTGFVDIKHVTRGNV